MADCQICGKPAVGEGKVEGARVPVCRRCAGYAVGFVLFKPVPSLQKARPGPALQSSSLVLPSAPARPSSGEMELVEDFGRKMMQAREKQGLTRKELARKMLLQEKELEGFEQEKFKPGEGVVRKLEFVLGVSLREPA